MKTKVFFLAALSATVMMTSCNNDDEVTNDGTTEIRLSSGITPQVRASFSTGDTQIAAGDTVAVYVDDATATTQLYGKNVLTADGSGNFTGGTAMFFPQTGNAVNIYAFHTNGTLATAFPTAEITHAVSADQTAQAGYLGSDLLYASKTNVARTTSAVELTFYHLLSKVQIALKEGNGLSATDVSKVEIMGTKLNAKFTPSTALAANAQTITKDGTATAIKIEKTFSADFSSYNDAIIVPQAVADNSDFIKLTLNNGGVLVYKLAAGTTFESGKKYIYHITANLTGLTVTSTIEDWEAVGAATTGNAEM